MIYSALHLLPPHKCSLLGRSGSALHLLTSLNVHPESVRKLSFSTSLGSVRADIPSELKGESWSRLGINVESNYDPLYVVPSGKNKIVGSLLAAAKEAERVFLATDGDREGEAIANHLRNLLIREGGEDKEYLRVTFTEITSTCVLDSMNSPRTVDPDLVSAQEARRIVDRLAGFTVSPVLWRKVAPGLSAGRVQSVGLSLVVDRERERMAYKKTEWYDAQAEFEGGVKGELVEVAGVRVAKGKVRRSLRHDN